MKYKLHEAIRSFISGDESTYVHLFDLGIKLFVNAILLVWSKDQSGLSPSRYLKWEENNLEEFYAHYGSQVDASSIGGEISVYTPHRHRTEMRLDNSGCVLAYHGSDDFIACSKCISLKKMTLSPFSAITSLIEVKFL